MARLPRGARLTASMTSSASRKGMERACSMQLTGGRAAAPVSSLRAGKKKIKAAYIQAKKVNTLTSWQEASIPVNNALNNVFMKPAIKEVDELLAYGVDVTIYNGQFDLICSTIGVEAWVNKLKWGGLKNFLSLPRQDVLLCDTSEHCSGAVMAFVKSYKNLHFYRILGAGHRVPVDKPDIYLKMIGQITKS